ncbi:MULTISPECIES: YraN family protein [unclassified Rhizobium]|uniref:YraN family protein n=1 Tax=unclassified Rhizobium TaxID=2613769 RepID=UPI00146AB80F|nr:MULTISPECIES: YraN family protein [unclassified Rhizobium]MBB3287352.1 putative endonuclease [Rhizobium sp. BK252]MBB3402092.1 putative endonuclease [Rhizobium sp. BK289]MBB3414669.1 putative endonuclease [Rhizobium sp. BK284]MBB3482558.1 putative endonuclease [Rhizobium sp. BK347]MDK4721237.1 YraN family protein [Rhizobium sp. CNPSo 3968]
MAEPRFEVGEKLKRQKAWRRGHMAEYLAAAFLMLKGYRILAIRHRTKLGEIDIVARKGDLAIFVEVKSRRGAQEAIDAVSFSSQNRIRAASDLWLARQPDFARLSQRYDIVAMLPGRWPQHFPDAF